MRRNTSVRYPGGRGTLWGVAAYLVGFGIAYGLVSTRLSRLQTRTTMATETSTLTLAELGQNAQVPTWKWAGLAFYNSHAVDVVASGLPAGLRNATQQVNLLAEAGGPFLLMFAVTPLLLVAAGALANRSATDPTELRFDVYGTGRTRFFVNGGLVTFFGYLPLALLGGVALTVDLDGNAVLRADLLESLLVAGMIYPVVFGGIGGYLRSYVT